MDAVGALLDRLAVINAKDRGPFPYRDCRMLLEGTSGYEELIPDLDSYFSELAGYASSGPRLLQWRTDKVNQVRGELTQTFYDRFPKYRPLAPRVTAATTPDLFAALRMADEKRAVLTELMREMVQVRP